MGGASPGEADGDDEVFIVLDALLTATAAGDVVRLGFGAVVVAVVIEVAPTFVDVLVVTLVTGLPVPTISFVVTWVAADVVVVVDVVAAMLPVVAVVTKFAVPVLSFVVTWANADVVVAVDVVAAEVILVADVATSVDDKDVAGGAIEVRMALCVVAASEA